MCAVRPDTAGGVHSNAVECHRRPLLPLGSKFRMVPAQESVHRGRAHVRDTNHRPVLITPVGSVPSLLQLGPGPAFARRRLRPGLARREELDLPTNFLARTRHRPASHRGCRSGGGSAILASSDLVPNPEGNIRLFACVDGTGDAGHHLAHADQARRAPKQAMEDPLRPRTGVAPSVTSLLAEADVLVQHALRPTTRKNYERVQAIYEQHCASYLCTPYPVSWQSISSFVVCLSHDNLKVSTIRSYSSAVVTRNQFLGYKMSDQLQQRVDQLFRGLENQAVEISGPAKVQPAMNSSVIVMISDFLDRQGFSATSVEITSQCAAVVFGYLFALRASTLTAIRLGDVRLRHNVLELNEIKRKSKSAQTVRTVCIPTDLCKPARVLGKYIQWAQSRNKDTSGSAFGFDMDAPPHKLVGDAIQVAAAQSEGMTSHSLRRGAAVSMFAVGVPIQRMLSWGAWASEDSVKPYIKDRAWNLATKDDRTCFAWML